MPRRFDEFSAREQFWNGNKPKDLIERFGSPLYIYNERLLRERCRELAGLVSVPGFAVHYSAKANSNPALLRIIREEGLLVDAMSIGEIAAEEAAGYQSREIMFVSNNISREEMAMVLEKGIDISVDSLAQLRLLGSLCPGARVCLRLNGGVGAGHHSRVVTGGHNTKFGIDPTKLDEARAIIRQYGLRWVGVNQHIGSLFMEGAPYLEGVETLLAICRTIGGLEYIDFGGGFGVPYHIRDGESRLDLAALGRQIEDVWTAFAQEYESQWGQKIRMIVESGRYAVAECGILLGCATAVKTVYENRYVGTDIGFNVLMRPILYDSYHEIELYKDYEENVPLQEVSVVGNICESGDVLAKGRLLAPIEEEDILGVLTAGAYGYAMASGYNNRLRPAEVLIREDGSVRLIRRRETVEDQLALTL